MARLDVLDTQLAELRNVHPTSEYSSAHDGTHIVTVRLSLGPGWSLANCDVEFVVPIPYPSAQPDCFYADPSLLLANGTLPGNSGFQPLRGENRLWFSWHLQQPWIPGRHTLLTYVRFIQERLRNAH